MERDEKRGGLLRYPVLILFSVFFVGVFVLDCLTPDREISELENTTLTQRPAITAQILTAQGPEQLFQQLHPVHQGPDPRRDGWISLQSFVETALFQKTQSGGVLLGSEGQMFNRTFGLVSSEEKTFPRNVAAVTSLSARYPGKVYAMVVPAASVIYPERVPAAAPILDETVYLNQIQTAVEESGGTFVSVEQTLADHKDEYIYYRTDHHWTTLGAYYAYSQLCDLLGLTPFDLDSHQPVEIPDFYGTFYSRARTWNAQPDTLTYYDLDNPMTIYTVTGAGMRMRGRRRVCTTWPNWGSMTNTRCSSTATTA